MRDFLDRFIRVYMFLHLSAILMLCHLYNLNGHVSGVAAVLRSRRGCLRPDHSRLLPPWL